MQPVFQITANRITQSEMGDSIIDVNFTLIGTLMMNFLDHGLPDRWSLWYVLFWDVYYGILETRSSGTGQNSGGALIPGLYLVFVKKVRRFPFPDVDFYLIFLVCRSFMTHESWLLIVNECTTNKIKVQLILKTSTLIYYAMTFYDLR